MSTSIRPVWRLARQPIRPGPFQIDGKSQAVIDIRLAVHQRRFGMQAAQLRVAELGRAVADAKLVKARAFAHQGGEGLRADLGIKRAAITRLDAVETLRAVGDQPGEDIDAAGRAFGIGDAGNAGGKFRPLQQRDDIDAARFQHRAMAQIHFMHEDGGEFFFHRGVGSGQEAGPHPPGLGAQAQIDAGGLDLAGGEGLVGRDFAALRDQALQHMAGQDAGGETAIAAVFFGLDCMKFGHGWVIGRLVERNTQEARFQPRKSRISPIASARPQRLTGAASGKAARRRDGVAPSRITKQPRSSGPRISRPNACFSRKRVRRSS